MSNFSKFVKDNIVIASAVAVVVVFVLGVSIYNYIKGGGGVFGTVSAQTAGNKAVNYINDNYLKDTGKAVFESATSDSTLYLVKFKISVTGQATQEDSAYVTKDGRYLFPQMQGIPIDLNQKVGGTTASASDGSKVSTCDKVQKSDKPLVEAFVVSSCPFGLQMQRVLADVVQNIPAAKSNIKVEYFGSISNGKITSMHGDAEAQENLKQMCIRQEQPALYWNYIACYIKAGDSKGCLASTGVNQASLTGCTTDASRGLKYAQADFALADKYGVSGSPTLIVSGDTVDEFGFGGRTSDALKSVICCSFKTKPSFCSQTLSKISAATSFSATYSQGTSGSSGNSGATGANCAPATPK